MSDDGYTVDELVEANAAMNEQADGLFDRLGRISVSAADGGIEVRVNLEGRLIGLDLTPDALALEPAELAAEIFRLTQQASATALAEGLDALEPVAGEELTAELSEIIGARPRPAPQRVEPRPEPVPASRPRTLDDHDDFSAVESWALPR